MARVLVIDDSPTLLEYVSELLRDLGHEPVACVDWVQANRLVHQQRPDLVLLDQHLGAFRGTFVARAFRSFFGDSLPLVIMSGEDVFDAAQAAGADAFIPKEWLGSHLGTLMDTLLSRPPEAPAEPTPLVVTRSGVERGRPEKRGRA